MPTYEYACTTCGDHLEVVQSFRDDALTTCPSCSGTLRKVFGSIGVVFKGSGFYKTDSRSGTKSGTSASSSEKSSSEKSSSEKSPSEKKASDPTSASGTSAGSSSGASGSSPSAAAAS